MAIISNDRPAYRIRAEHGFFGPDGHLYEEGSALYFDGEPNEEMEALNDLARENLKTLWAKLDECAAEVAKKTGKAFVRPKSFEEAVMLAGAVEKARNTPVMRAELKNAHMATAIIEDETPETTVRRGPGRPKKSAPGPMQIAG